jgi:hypothetical protein
MMVSPHVFGSVADGPPTVSTDVLAAKLYEFLE